MQIKTEQGIAESLPLSDIQEYNNVLKNNTEELKRRNRIEFIEMIIKTIILIVILWLIYYVISNNVFNNIIFEVTKCDLK